MLNELPTAFDYIITVLHALGEEFLSFGLVKSRLLQKEERSISKMATNSTDSVLLHSSYET